MLLDFHLFSKCACFAVSNFLLYALLWDWWYFSQLITMDGMTHTSAITPWILLQYLTLVQVLTGETLLTFCVKHSQRLA
jgi:hypothetical protein